MPNNVLRGLRFMLCLKTGDKVIYWLHEKMFSWTQWIMFHPHNNHAIVVSARNVSLKHEEQGIIFRQVSISRHLFLISCIISFFIQ